MLETLIVSSAEVQKMLEKIYCSWYCFKNNRNIINTEPDIQYSLCNDLGNLLDCRLLLILSFLNQQCPCQLDESLRGSKCHPQRKGQVLGFFKEIICSRPQEWLPKSSAKMKRNSFSNLERKYLADRQNYSKF